MIAWIKKQVRDPLYKNSFYVMLTSVTSAGFGFVFWMLAAKLYLKEDVGVATALISAMSFLVLLSRFGFDFSIIRFFPENDKSKIFNTSVIITSFFAVVFGFFFVLGVDFFSPELHLLKSPLNSMLFLVFVGVSSVVTLMDTSFVAVRGVKRVLFGLEIIFFKRGFGFM